MSKKQIELYVGYTDHTWNTIIVEVPSNIDPDLLEEIYCLEIEKLTKNNPQYLLKNEVAFTGLYNECPFEEEENEKDSPFFFEALVEYSDPISKERRCYRYIIEATNMTEATKKLEAFTPTYYTLRMKPIKQTNKGYIYDSGKSVEHITCILSKE